MKFNWGTGIVLVILIFMAGMALLVYITFQSSVDLVYEDYYPRELEHQTMIDKRNNALELSEKVLVETQNNAILITFPAIFNFEELKGEIQLFRPSGKTEDVFIQLKPDANGLQVIPTDGLTHGKYIVKLEWESSGVFYYMEQDVFIDHE